MSDYQKAGRVRLIDFGKSHSAKWRVVGETLEITSPYGTTNVPLGTMRVSPAILAHEAFREIVKQNNRIPKQSPSDRARFNVRDA